MILIVLQKSHHTLIGLETKFCCRKKNNFLKREKSGQEWSNAVFEIILNLN